MKGIVDRIESNMVVLEVGDETLEIKLSEFPKEIKEGDLVLIEKDGYKILKQETEDRQKEMDDLLNLLFKKD